MNNSEPTWVPAEPPPVPDPSPHNGVANPTTTVKEEEGNQTPPGGPDQSYIIDSSQTIPVWGEADWSAAGNSLSPS